MDIGSTIKKTLLATFAAVAIVAGGLISLGLHLDSQHAEQQQARAQAVRAADQQAKAKASAEAAKQMETITYGGVTGLTALEILRARHVVTVGTFSLGERVMSIDGLEGSGSKYWTFYVNGRPSTVGASSYITKDDDRITWKLEQF